MSSNFFSLNSITNRAIFSSRDSSALHIMYPRPNIIVAKENGNAKTSIVNPKSQNVSQFMNPKNASNVPIGPHKKTNPANKV